MVFARAMSLYESAIARHPLKTKMAMSAAVLGVADVGAQMLQHRQLTEATADDKEEDDNNKATKPRAFQLDMTRQQAVCVYSLGFQGPFGHWWYNFLEHTMAPKVPARYVVGAKVLCDQAVNALASNVIYFSFIPWFEGKAPEDIKQKLRMDLGPTHLIDCAFWPITSYFNFRYVPVRHQLLSCNVVLLVWTLFMSYVCHDDALLRAFDAYNPFLREADHKMLRERCVLR
jgi:hypothetical protein